MVAFDAQKAKHIFFHLDVRELQLAAPQRQVQVIGVNAIHLTIEIHNRIQHNII